MSELLIIFIKAVKQKIDCPLKKETDSENAGIAVRERSETVKERKYGECGKLIFDLESRGYRR